MLMLVFSISPILAPLTGSLVIQAVGWRGVFWVVFAAALVGFVVLTTMRETRPAAARAGARRVGITGTLADYGRLLRDRSFLGLVFTGAFGLSSFFVYLSGSPFVLIDHYRLSPRLFSVVFSLNAASFFATAQANAWLAQRIGLRVLVRVAAAGFALVLLLLLGLFAWGVDRLEVLAVLLFLSFAFLVMLLAGALSNGSPLPMVAGIAACGVVACTLAQATLRTPQRARAETAAD